MRLKGVLFLGLAFCCLVLCNGEDGSMNDYGTRDALLEELAKDYLILRDDDVDVCENYECLNDGVCYKDNDAAKCNCTGTWIGDKCDQNVCETFECQNGGVCYKENDAAKCNCTGTWIGDKCDQNVCANHGCQNGGECYKENNAAKCRCTGTWVGDKCDRDVCANNPCKNGGKCSKEGSNFKCDCTGIWAGKTCEQKCDCGPKGTCELKNGKKICNCSENYAEKNGKCTETCEDGVCDRGIECVSFNGPKFCNCTNGLSGDRCEIIDDCVGNGIYKDCKPGKGTCEYDETNKKATCNCDGGMALDSSAGYCKETCQSDDECNGGKCEGKDGEKICKCKSGREGDKCDIITECVKGIYKKCEETGGTCAFEDTRVTCNCTGEKVLDTRKPQEQLCRHKCNSKTNDCENGGKCNSQTNLCDCNPKTYGDKCENIEDCGSLNCTAIKAKCSYDVEKRRPTCKCLDDDYYYENGECKAKWCENGCNLDVSKCDFRDGVGFCKCKIDDKYYDYTKRTCTPIDKCFKMECGENQVCSNGICECKENYKKVNKTCERQDLCSLDKCFPDAKCEENSNFGLVKCSCKSDSKFYLNKRCQDGNCFLPGQRKGCDKSCPSGMDRNKEDGECKYKDEKNKCEDNCGFLGWCFKASETAKPTCVCDPNYAEFNRTAKKCVLKASLCPNKLRDGDSKCKCTGQFKLADNGITCDLRSCSDEDVQKECKTRGAEKCVDNWKGDGYKCVCPTGYIDDKKGCLDPCSFGDMMTECSSKGQTCYIGAQDRTGSCRCPPSFTYNTGKQSCEISSAATFMIHKLPVLKEMYEIGENNINKVALNRDIFNAMMLANNLLEFAQLYNYKVENDIIQCDVWLQFKPESTEKFNATLEVHRWSRQLIAVKKNWLIPPRLLMSSKLHDVKDIKEEKVTLCTPTVLQDVCGRGSTCDEDKGCSCAAGYKEIPSTLKISDKKRLVRCEDVDECHEGSHKCPANSKCINTLGDYFCKCNPGFKKAKGEADALDKESCVGLCDPNPCGKGSCQVTKEFTVECKCQVGFTGSFCKDEDVNLAKASKATKVVGAVLGTILAIVIILIVVYIVRQRKNSYSEDFTPAPRVDNAEMIERRPMRGVTNRAYQ